MLGRGRLVLALVALTVLGGVQAAPATAEGEPDTGAFNAFNLKGSNGYRINVLAVSSKGYRKGQVLILVSRKRQSVTYFAPAKVTNTDVEADLGALGVIDVTFQPSGREGSAHPVCDRSQSVTYEKGSYVGAIDLRGEEGYTRVRVESAPYSLHPFADLICPGYSRSEETGRGIPGARLRARSVSGGKRLHLQVNQNRPGARVEISASLDERLGRIQVSREVQFDYPVSAFEFAPDLRAASLEPPAPFSGAALYRGRARPANRWTGNLAVDFPGHSNVSLTGARFESSLVHARFTEETLHYDRFPRPNLLAWPSTKPSPIASATSSLLALK